ncbi:MAG: hypothetical protein ACLQO7_13060 [Candidatus Bathyarchaeia archaeon]
MAAQIIENRTSLYLTITRPSQADSYYFHEVIQTHKTGNAA